MILKIHTVTAQKISRGRGETYLFALPISIALKLLEIPDPAYPFAGNRRVNKGHAQNFGDYWESNENSWVVPPVLLDSNRELKSRQAPTESIFTKLVNIDFEEVKDPEIRILDGQHRIYGWYLKQLDLDSRLKDATSSFNKAIAGGKSDLVNAADKTIQYLNHHIKRLDTEYVAINLIDGLDQKSHEQFFVDIAKNALGINKTVQSKYDTRFVVNRVTKKLYESHPLLVDRTELEKTKCSESNPNILSIVNIADIVRALCFGINSRVTPEREAVMQDDSMLKVSSLFFDLMVKNFPPIEMIIKKRLTPKELREKHLIGSSTMWRCFAGGFFEFCVVLDTENGRVEIDEARLRKYEKMLHSISLVSSYPISKDWMNTEQFPNRESKAPHSRTQNLIGMAQLLASWAESGELFSPKNTRGFAKN